MAGILKDYRMENKPNIQTAIPKRRYKLGEFTIILLGEIESNDANHYRYITAVIQEGDPEPGIYLTCEKSSDGNHAMRLIMRDGSEVLDYSPDWKDQEPFMQACITTLQKLLDLSDEQPFRLM